MNFDFSLQCAITMSSFNELVTERFSDPAYRHIPYLLAKVEDTSGATNYFDGLSIYKHFKRAYTNPNTNLPVQSVTYFSVDANRAGRKIEQLEIALFDPKQVVERLLLAERFADEKNQVRAKQIVDVCLQDHHNKKHSMQLAVLADKIAEYAETLFRRAILCDKDNVEAIKGLASSLPSTDDEVESLLLEAMKKDPKQYDTYTLLGDNARDRGNPRQAILYYIQAKEMSHGISHFTAIYPRLALYELTGSRDDLLDALNHTGFKRSLKKYQRYYGYERTWVYKTRIIKDPADAKAVAHLAKIYLYEKKDPEKAKEYFDYLETIDPYNRGLQQYRRGFILKVIYWAADFFLRFM